MTFREPRRLVLAALALAFGAGALALPRAVAPAESRIDFVVKEMGVPVKGAFTRFDSSLDIDPADAARSSAVLRIDVSSLTTGTPEADAIAVGKDWLDAAHARYATFRSTSFRALGGGRFEAKGQLTLRNVARDMTVQFTSTEQPGGRTVIDSAFAIHRADFGIGAGEWNEPGIVADDIPVQVRLVLAAPAAGGR